MQFFAPKLSQRWEQSGWDIQRPHRYREPGIFLHNALRHKNVAHPVPPCAIVPKLLLQVANLSERVRLVELMTPREPAFLLSISLSSCTAVRNHSATRDAKRVVCENTRSPGRYVRPSVAGKARGSVPPADDYPFYTGKQYLSP